MDCKAFTQGWALPKGETALSNLPWIVWIKRSKGCPSTLMIEAYSMVRTEADMIVNQNNHHHIDYHHIIHHQGTLYNVLNLLNFFMKRNCTVPSITTMRIMKTEGCSIIGKRRFVNSIPSRRSEFSNTNRRSKFSNFICEKGGGHSNLDEVSNSILSFDGSLDVELTFE